MARSIRKAAVIGAGVMGSGIAAHLANVGIPVHLLDIVPQSLTEEEEKKGLTLQHPAVRNRFSIKGIETALKSKPASFYNKEDADLITVGNLEDDLNTLRDADWIIEVVVENLEVKKSLFERIEPYRKEGAIVSTNTSGISVNKMIEGRSLDFRQHFVGTHFFNPPRYLKLLEIIPNQDTLPEVVDFISRFAEKTLGKGVVIAKDTVNFIANRIGTYGLQVTIHEMMNFGLSIDEVDSLTGPVIGRPKSATFRTLDVVGLDTYVHVANNVRANVTEEYEKEAFIIPEFIQEMVTRKWLGQKTKQGFYLKQGNEILTLDYTTLEYGPKKKMKAPSLEAAKAAKGLPAKLKALVYADDKAGKFTWNILKKVFLYSAEKLGEIADDIVSIDRAMKWGFNWEMGPFEMWDSIGLEKSVKRMEEEGEIVPKWVKDLLVQGKTSFYQQENGVYSFYVTNGEYRLLEEAPEKISLKALKEQKKVIKSNSGASLIDLGDGVACLEFHSPNNAIGADIIQMINYSVDEVARNYEGMVIGNQSKNFCVGANLMLLLMEAQDENWFEIEMIVKQFQDATMKLKYSEKPVVAAPYGMTLGGGAEVVLPTAKVQASAETYIGLVEVGVGLIPGGGGNKELLLRHLEGIPEGANVDLQPLINQTFEKIAMAKVSTSGKEGKTLGFFRKMDQISYNQDFLIYDAKQAVLSLAKNGYQPPKPKKIRVVGESGYAVMKLGAYSLKVGGQISDHDMKIAEKLAFVLAGGRVPAGSLVTEQYLLDIEREAFLSLSGEPKTQERMLYMLQKGKPLRN
ncbi:3-hydroxyacyl-CoA dehydrogenase NAD-binding domain-containing protein [Microaerobacter geothermalis]|uniref:3-hydroxyacyl-CoA dehydrogenase/enoyl-CoA hydratase family protein n=1 Tax=Microaerobacter geothermalis TaxID=674972 RepID=UPI001F17F9D7|nr:3-hydroxyacyl-CoA dehydrogenase/enoyl-CoA hydratase family protein [Microaerobacter geothermalis]MCF6093651.1 3-hydroxyacyl-CoA dehydrogenase NAD-binding domain-containing protein [Microaerobacter geothermalis]